MNNWIIVMPKKSAVNKLVRRRRGPSSNPHMLPGRKDVWWYEDEKGIDVVLDARIPIINIPWKDLKAAMKRCCPKKP